MRTQTILAATVAAALIAPAAASAHVTLQPKEAPAGGFTVLNVRVPNEQDDASTTEVRVQLPDGFGFVSYQPVPGWKVTLRREKLTTPIKTGDGELTEQVKEVTFEGGAIAPGQFRDFPLSVGVPNGKPGSKLTFKAIQTYSNGDVVRWIGSPGSDTPAPQVTLTAAAAAPAAAKKDEGGSDGLAIAALVFGVLGLAAGLAGLETGRRRTRVAA